MPWKGSSCPYAAGWQERLLTKTFAAAGIGAVGGAVLSVLQRQPLLPHMGTTAASSAICISLFGVLQEGARLVRCDDGPFNSAFGASTASYLLVSAYRGRAQALPTAMVCGAGAGALHWACQRLGPAWRRTLVSLDLLDNPEARRQLEAAREFRPLPEAELGWRRWLPIRQMTAEEWARHQAKKAAGGIRARAEAAQAGGLAGLLEQRAQDSTDKELQAEQQHPT